MKQLALEFIERRRVPWAGLFFMLVSMGACALTLHRTVAISTEVQQLEQQLEQLSRQRNERQRAAAAAAIDPALLAKQRVEQERLLAALNYPWNSVLTGVERSKPAGVAILSLTHSRAEPSTQLLVEAADMPALVQFVDTMNEGRTAHHWYLATYQLTGQTGAGAIRARLVEQ